MSIARAAAPPRPAAVDGPPSGGRRFALVTGAIAAAGLVWRAIYVLATRGDASLCGNVLCGDALWYSGQARVNAEGHWFRLFTDVGQPAADHPPLTPVLLTPVSWLAPESVTAQRLAMVVLGTAVVVAVAYLGRHVAGDRAGWVAAGLAAANANFWMNDVIVMSETVGTLALVVALLATYRFIDQPTLARAAALGLACGVAGLARAELLLLLPVTVLPVALAARSLSVGARLGRVALAGAVAAACVLPWTAYNLARFERPVLISTNDGLTLIGANCDRVYGVDGDGGLGFWNLTCAYDHDAALALAPDEVGDQSEVSARYRDAAVAYVGDHVDRVPAVVAARLGRGWAVWKPSEMVWLNLGEARAPWASWTGMVTWWLLVPAAVVGAVLLRRRGTPLWPLLSMAVVVTITLVAFYGIVRFRLPADVAAVVLAGVAGAALWDRVRPRQAAPGTAPPEAPLQAEP